MNKKIAIITYQNGKNYGGFLQAYSLQKILDKNKDLKVDIINYKSLRFIIKEVIILLKSKNPIKIILNFLSFFSYFIYRKKLELKKFTIIKKKAIRENYAYIIYGSDEIWNFNNNLVGFDTFYFGDGCNQKKIAFSVSFGTVKENQKQLSNIKKYLKKFSKISVRDTHSSKILNNLNIQHQLTLDPVFLYDFKDELSKINFKNQNKKYILIYGIISDKKIIENIKLYKKDKNYKIISIGFYNSWVDKNIVYSIDPFLFLKIFKNSEIVFTSMFHGVILSIKFNKKFFIIKDNYRVNKLSYLTKKFKLKFLYNNQNYNLTEFKKQINFLNLVNKKILLKNINSSLTFLKNI